MSRDNILDSLLKNSSLRLPTLPVVGLTNAIFAHEIAHAVINSAYAEPLPPKLQEVLAHYVYNNLGDE